MTRRSILLAALANARSRRFRLAVCSETFKGLDFRERCRAAVRIGYEGLEIDPSDLGEDPAALTGAERRRDRDIMRESGIACVGLHSFLKTPAGLHLTAGDVAARQRSWDYFRRLIDLAADLGDGPVMVLGSSRQRQAVDGVTPREAAMRLEEGLGRMAPAAAARGVTILLEPLAPHLCNVVNTLDEAIGIVERIGSPAVESMFDTHNTTAETQPLPALIRKHFRHLRHVHLNELDGRYPGAGNFDFTSVLQTFKELEYRHWVSVEVFDFKPDGETVARRAHETIRRLER